MVAPTSLGVVTTSVTAANTPIGKSTTPVMNCNDLESTITRELLSGEPLTVVTEHQETCIPSELSTDIITFAGITGSVAGVTANTHIVKPANMSTKTISTDGGENSTLLAIARLETKLEESHKNDFIEMEKRLTTNMKMIVDNSI